MHPSDARRNGSGMHKMLTVPAADRQVTVRIALKTYRQLEALAKREKRSVSKQAAYFIEHGLARAAAQHEPLEIKSE